MLKKLLNARIAKVAVTTGHCGTKKAHSANTGCKKFDGDY